MAGDASSEGELEVSKCQCETGRKRHCIPKSIQIPFESDPPVDGPTIDDYPPDVIFSNVAEFEVPVVDMLAEAQAQNAALVAAGLAPGDPMPDEWDDEFDVEVESVPSDDEDSAQTFYEMGYPQVAVWRLNLTALSQVYNMYMVAYADRIYVSRPRSCINNALPAEPDLILQPAQSEAAKSVSGDIYGAFPHQVNHLIVADFGHEEILLLAYDDGDAIGYYTRHIENELKRRDNDTDGLDNGTTVKPFFHENVGRSAWGLAVHKESRIIAVSSNLHAVCVFVFALTGKPYQHIPEADTVEFFRNVTKDYKGRYLDKDRQPLRPHWAEENLKRIAGLERAIQRRDANWRIHMETGPVGTNIPNIAFSTDEEGEADQVVAVDIHGAIWLMDFWKFNRKPPTKIDRLHQNQLPYRPRAWGVLVLPESSFLPTKNYQDSVGLAKAEEAHYVDNPSIGRWVDISQGVHHIPNNSVIHPWVRFGETNRFGRNPNLPPRQAYHHKNPWFDFKKTKLPTPACDMDEGVASPRRKSALSKYRPPSAQPILYDGSSIMRTYEVDVELRSHEDGGCGIIFENVIAQDRPAQTTLPTVGGLFERLANLIHVPELSLVVAGSLCGRVALITLTRPKEQKYSFKRAFKVEAILPTKQDENRRLRPICPLLGVAVSPIPSSGNIELADRPSGRRRYRIMLHYYDLRILSYEISRSSATDHLSII